MHKCIDPLYCYKRSTCCSYLKNSEDRERNYIKSSKNTSFSINFHSIPTMTDFSNQIIKSCFRKSTWSAASLYCWSPAPLNYIVNRRSSQILTLGFITSSGVIVSVCVVCPGQFHPPVTNASIHCTRFLNSLFKAFKTFRDAPKMIDLKGIAPNGTYLVHLVYATTRMSQKYRWYMKVLQFFRRCLIFQ